MNDNFQASIANGDGKASVTIKPLTAVIVSATDKGRRALAAALEGAQAQVIREAPMPGRDDLPGLLEEGCDVLIVDIDGQPEPGLEIVEAACAFDPSLTIM